MSSTSTPPAALRVAVTQAEPVWLDLAATVDKTVKLIEEAAKGGAKLVAFPETWIPGYPTWIWARVIDPTLHTRYILNSLRLDSPEMEKIKAAAKEHGICVVLGFSERTESDSLYISQGIIAPDGTLVVKRRKVKPTHMERTIFGDGSGPDLLNVATIDFGPSIGPVKIGTLACWEHTQPLLKYHTYSQHEAVHIAMWPPIYPHGGVDAPGLYSMSAEGCLTLSQAYAIESGAFVLHCTAVCGKLGVETCETQKGVLFTEPGGGDSAVLGPDGRKLTERVEGGGVEEGMVFADLELVRGVGNKGFVDGVGHYSRPDLLWLGVDRREKRHVVEEGKGSG
ncbi:putative nitrilase [Periconia macrospinosa]|uniref:nitrilase n=1 Tax=Periconia macrospinosa TaxID=97972 RepID=A0A2V1DUA3_9PLEO|nr:putative nitrilase [Periconia macrospinosa]